MLRPVSSARPAADPQSPRALTLTAPARRYTMAGRVIRGREA